MQSIVKGLTVTLYEKTELSVDDFGQKTYTEEPVEVNNVFIQPVADDGITSNLEIAGTHNAYVLHIPKGDAHKWEDSIVYLPEPYNLKVKTYTSGMIYRNDLVPLDWNKQIKAEIYG